jgi:hypothetical protein
MAHLPGIAKCEYLEVDSVEVADFEIRLYVFVV